MTPVTNELLMWVEWCSPHESEAVSRNPLDKLKAAHSDNFGWALACCLWQRDLAEDVLQEAYLRVLDGRAVFSGKSSLKTWFFAVIKRVAGEWQRRQRRRAILDIRLLYDSSRERDDTGSADFDSPASALQTEESTRQLREALMQLSRRQREVLHLVFYGEFTLEDAAETLGISVGSARTHYHRGKLRLAELLALEQSDE
jgi:RNA polymerase sigma-70 factor (ECF subfamily)